MDSQCWMDRAKEDRAKESHAEVDRVEVVHNFTWREKQNKEEYFYGL